MNRFYLIVPIVLCGMFGFIYVNHTKDAEAKATQIAAEKKAKEDDAAAKKKEAERKSREDADKRTAERIADEKKKEDDKRAKWEAQGKEIADATAKYIADGESFAKQAAKLESELSATRAAKDKANREAFELLKGVELAKIAKRTAEMEVQRMTEMVSRKAAESSLAKVAAAPAPTS